MALSVEGELFYHGEEWKSEDSQCEDQAGGRVKMGRNKTHGAELRGTNFREYPKNFTSGSQKNLGADRKALKFWHQMYRLLFLSSFSTTPMDFTQ